MQKTKAKKILVIRSGAIGDIIMVTPFLRNLKENFPDSKISFLVGNWSKDVLKNNPNIHKIISFEDEIIIKKKLFRVFSLIKNIKKERFGLCFILDKSWMWNLFALLCGIKERIGFSRGKEGIWNTLSLPFNGTKNEADYNIELLKKAGITGINTEDTSPQIFTSKKDKEYAVNFMKKIDKKTNKKIIGICPGGAVNPGQSAAIKRWPLKRYIELTNSISYNFIIFGNKKDKEISQKIISESKNNYLYDACANSIQEAKELMEKCDIIISHDSGSLHIASVAKTETIALFGPTPSKRFCPKKTTIIETKTLPCYTIYGKFRNCKENQMEEILVEQVINSIKKLIA